LARPPEAGKVALADHFRRPGTPPARRRSCPPAKRDVGWVCLGEPAGRLRRTGNQ